MSLRALAISLLFLLTGAAALAGEEPASTFLADVEPLISPAERAAYLELTRPYQRRAFERRFWELRDPFPETPRNELEERYQERLRLARERYPEAQDDRFRMMLLNGEPARRIQLRCADLLRPGEIWIFGTTDRIPRGFALVFVSTGVSASSPHRLWSPRSGYAELLLWSVQASGDLAAEMTERIPRDCPRGEEILGGLAGASDWSELEQKYDVIPHPNPEWVRTFLSYSTDLPDDALPLAAEVEIQFRGRNQSRTIVDASVIVETAALQRSPAGIASAPPAADDAPAKALLLDGEVLRGEELFDHFRYRFEFSAQRLREATTLPLSARRFLRPGSYTLILRLQDPDSGLAFRRELPLVVPTPGSLAAGAEPRAEAASPAAAPAAAAATASSPGQETPSRPEMETAVAALPTADPGAGVEPSLRLLAPTDRLTLGRVRIEADVRGAEPARVDFELDGKPLFSKRRPPFSVEIDLGNSPRLRRVRATAFDAAGELLAADEVLLNAGPHRFAIRLTEPQRTPPAGMPVDARAEIDLPEGEELDRVEFYLNDTRLATLYQPPFAVSLTTPPIDGLTFLRAVAYLAGGGAAEDVRLLGSEASDEAVEVDFVELYASVLDKRGRPVTDLGADDFRVREDGVPQQVRRFENVDSMPIHAGVMIDTSASMVEELTDAVAAADRFFREVLTPLDRAAVITFADAPRLAVRFTGNLELLAGGLAGLQAAGETRFYDSLAFALHYFSGVRGKRALVLLTDGADSKSHFRYSEVLEYARRTGVTIYAIGLNVPTKPVDAGAHLDQLARETGGRSFRIRHANELASVYETIRQELRSQYLLAYQSSRLDGSTAYREIEVDADPPGLSVRTISGYYP